MPEHQPDFLNQGQNIHVPQWLGEGLVVAGEWQGLRRHTRESGYSPERIERSKKCFTAANLRRFKDCGVNLVLCEFYSGFGVAAEQAVMAEAVKIAERCHALEMRVGVYVQTTGSIMPETLFLEKPEAEQWVSRDQHNNIPRYGDCDWRYIPCPTCDELHQYIKDQVLKFACQTVKADLIHLDNFRWWGEPEACRCPRCAQRFRQYLERRFPTEAERVQRFGIEDFSLVRPPVYYWLRPPWKIRAIRDPMAQAWQDFKCDYLTKLYQDYLRFITAINPEIALECNITPPLGANPAINRGAWPADVYRFGHAFWCEQKERSGVNENGILVSRIRSYKTATATGNRAFAYTWLGAPPKLSIAEAMAFNHNCLGMVAFLWQTLDDPDLLSYIRFFREHQNLYRGVSSAAQVAVLNSRATLCYHNEEPHLQLALAEQALIQSGVPFDTIFDRDLERLGQWRLLVLPDCQAMSDAQCDLVVAYVQNGGGLIVTGETACCRENLSPRSNGSRLKERLGAKFDKVVWLAALEPAVVLPPNEPGTFLRTRSYNQEWWALPKNITEFTAALEIALPEREFRLTAPAHVVLEAKRRNSDGALILHFLNYDPQRPVPVVCDLPAQSSITIYTPEDPPASQPGARVQWPRLTTYAVAEINRGQWKS